MYLRTLVRIVLPRKGHKQALRSDIAETLRSLVAYSASASTAVKPDVKLYIVL